LQHLKSSKLLSLNEQHLSQGTLHSNESEIMFILTTTSDRPETEYTLRRVISRNQFTTNRQHYI